MLAVIIFFEASYTTLIVRAERQQRLLAERSIGCHTSQGWVGCSVIWLGASSLSQIEKLLGTQYDRYEVITIIDASTQSTLFAQIIEQYGLVELNTPKSQPHNEFAIRSLYRSAQRRYRHIVLLDIASEAKPHEALNSALAVVSYNYVIPIEGKLKLRPHAIESIAIKLSDYADRNIHLLESLGEPSCQIFRYDSVVAQGGFTAKMRESISAHNTLYTYETYLCRQENQQLPNTKQENRQTQKAERAIFWQLLGGIAMFGGLVYVIINPMAIGSAGRMLIAALATIITLKTIARYQMAASGIAKCSLWSILCYFRRRVAIFSRRKFIVS